MGVDTMGGRMRMRVHVHVHVHVRWDEMAQATPHDAHITGVRGDAVTAKVLGLHGMVSEDTVR